MKHAKTALFFAALGLGVYLTLPRTRNPDGTVSIVSGECTANCAGTTMDPNDPNAAPSGFITPQTGPITDPSQI